MSESASAGSLRPVPAQTCRPTRRHPLRWVTFALATVALSGAAADQFALPFAVSPADGVPAAPAPDEELAPAPGVPPPVASYPAASSRFPPDLPVLGVSAGSVHRAYLLDTLTSVGRHVLTDRIADDSVAVTYCDRRDHGKVYRLSPDGDGQALRVVGFSRARGMILESSAGRFFQECGADEVTPDTGRSPAEVASARRTWGEWVAEHPDSVTVCYPSLFTLTARRTYPARSVPASADAVIGLTIHGRARAYLLDAFRDIHSLVVEDVVEGETVTIVRGGDRTRAFRIPDDQHPGNPISFAGWDTGDPDGGPLLDDGRQVFAAFPRAAGGAAAPPACPYPDVPCVRTTWREWRTAHPETSLYVGERIDRVEFASADSHLLPVWLRGGLVALAAVGFVFAGWPLVRRLTRRPSSGPT